MTPHAITPQDSDTPCNSHLQDSDLSAPKPPPTSNNRPKPHCLPPRCHKTERSQATPAAKGPGKVQQAFQRGLAALTQWVEREGAHRPVPRSHAEEITVDGETEPVTVKLGVWVSNARARRDKLTAEQLDALRGLGIDWA
nr:helicase associated domain-containing protein [Streptomyces netropsis]